MLKKIIAFILAIFMLVQMFPYNTPYMYKETYAEEGSEGFVNYTGQTQKGKYLISTKEQFKLLNENSAESNEYYSGSIFKLKNDIDMQSDKKVYISTFSGIFDGDNHSISNYSRSIFYQIQDGGVIRNTIFKNPITESEQVDRWSTYYWINSCIYSLRGSSCILNCHVNNVNAMQIQNSTGLLVNYIKDSIVSNCTSSGQLSLSYDKEHDSDDYPYNVSRVAGIVGSSDNSVIQDCVNYTNISGSSHCAPNSSNNISSMQAHWDYYCVGGIANVCSDGTKINFCENRGNIDVNGIFNGGIVGCLYDGSNIINNCNNFGNVGDLHTKIDKSGNEYIRSVNTLAGGICGLVFTGRSGSNEDIIEYCKNYGNSASGIVNYCSLDDRVYIRNCINYAFCITGFVYTAFAKCTDRWQAYGSLFINDSANKVKCGYSGFIGNAYVNDESRLNIYLRRCYNTGDINNCFFQKYREDRWGNDKLLPVFNRTGGFVGDIGWECLLLFDSCYNNEYLQYDQFAYLGMDKPRSFRLSNSYYNISYPNGENYKYMHFIDEAIDNSMKKTADEMKSPDFIDFLGSAYAYDSTKINDGFPVLKWELFESLEVLGDTELYKGTPSNLSAVVKPGNLSGLKYTWSVDKPDIVELKSKNSIVTLNGLKEGAVVVTCSVTYGGSTFAKSVIVTVNEPKFSVNDINIVGSSILETGYTTTIQSVYTTGIDTSKITYSWSVNSCLNIIGSPSTQNIKVKGIKAGSGVITLKAVYCGVEITKKFTLAVTNNFSSATVTIKGNTTLTNQTSSTFIASSNKTIKESDVQYIWTSSDTSILKLETGQTTKKVTIKGLKKGTATLSVRMTYYGITKTKSIVVTVKNIPLNSEDIKLTGNSIVYIDDLIPITVKLPNNINESLINFTWTINTPNLASYSTSMNGKTILLYGKKEGNFVLAMKLHYDDKTYTKTMNITVQKAINEIKEDHYLVGEKLCYLYDYSDPENDAIYSEEYKYIHNKNYLSDGIKLDNNLGLLDYNNIWNYTVPSMYLKPGTINLYIKIKDYPETTKNGVFEEYRKYSNELINTIYIHRKPIADFSITSNKISDKSYDLDHSVTMTNKGIQKWKWIYIDDKGNTKTFISTDKLSGINALNTYIANNIAIYSSLGYEIYLKVQDIEGVWSDMVNKKGDGTGGEIPEPPIQTEPNNPPNIDFNLVSNENPKWIFPHNSNITSNSILMFRPINSFFEEEKVKFISLVNDSDTNNEGFIYNWKIDKYLVKDINEILGIPNKTYNKNTVVPVIDTFKSSYGWGAYKITYSVTDKPPMPPYSEEDNKTASITKTYYVVPEITLNSSCECTDDSIVIGSKVKLKAQTNSFVTNVIAEFESNRISLNKVSESNGIINWSIDYVIPNTLPETGLYNIKFTASTNYGGNGFDTRKIEQTKSMYIVVNTAPIIEKISVVTDIGDTYFYEGDNTDVIIKAYDKDYTPLSVKIDLYSKSDLSNKLIQTISKTITPIDKKYPSLRCDLLDKISIGEYRVNVTITDNFGETVTDKVDFYVDNLYVTGAVTHTEKWNENRELYNAKYPEKARDEDTYWNGEGLVTSANTTVINENSNVVCKKVSVEIINKDYPFDEKYQQWLNSDNETNDKWSLFYCDKGWTSRDNYMICRWGADKKQELTLRFTAHFSNDWVETHDVIFYIDNREDFWKLHRAW